MKQKLDAQIATSISLPLEEFTKARKHACEEPLGGREKNRLARSSSLLPVWIINRSFWHDGQTYKALIDAARNCAPNIDCSEGRKADNTRTRSTASHDGRKGVRQIDRLAEKTRSGNQRQRRETIRRTLAALPGDEAAGRLTRPPSRRGRSFSGVKVRPEANVHSPKSKSKVQSQTSRVWSLELARNAREKNVERRAREERKAQEKRGA